MKNISMIMVALSLVALLFLGSLPIVLAEDRNAENMEGTDPEVQRREGATTRTRPDRDGDGYISYREFYAFVNGRLEDTTVQRIFNAADGDGDGQLSYREFSQALRLAANTRTDRTPCRPDRDGDGYISYREFSAFIGDRMTDERKQRLFDAADVDGDGKLSPRELRQVMLRIRGLANDRDEGGEDDVDEEREGGEGGESGIRQLLVRLFNAADRDGDGQISIREFFGMIRNLIRILSA